MGRGLGPRGSESANADEQNAVGFMNSQLCTNLELIAASAQE